MTSSVQLAIPLLLAAALNAQPPSLVLSQVSAPRGGGAVLELSYASVGDSPIAALQWTLQYPPEAVSAISLDDGDAASAAHKTVICLGDGSAYKCLAVGANAETISDGVLARVTVALTPGTTEATILVANTLGVSPDGQPVTVRGENRKIVFESTAIPRGAPRAAGRVAANR